MATIHLKKGYDIKLVGAATADDIANAKPGKLYAIVPDDFHGITPRMEKKEGERVMAGEALYHDKNHELIKVTSPVAGIIKEVRRGERRKIEAIVIEAEEQQQSFTFDKDLSTEQLLLQSGLWAMLRQRPYDVVPTPGETPRDIFVTAFDSAPLAPELSLVVGEDSQYIPTAIKALKSLTAGNVYLSCRPGEHWDAPEALVNEFIGPHPAGNPGIQAANIKPVNKGETVWTLDVVTLARIGKLIDTRKVDYTTVVALTGENVEQPQLVRATVGCSIDSLLPSVPDNSRIISGNVLTGALVPHDGFLRAPYRQITVIPEVSKPDEFMGWASLSPKRFSIYRDFTSWLCGSKRAVSMDARIKGGERAIVRLDEYDDMIPMDIYAEFLVKAIIAFDIDKMEKLGIYEVAPEDFALAEFACTSKLELQRIVREGLDKMRNEMV